MTQSVFLSRMVQRNRADTFDFKKFRSFGSQLLLVMCFLSIFAACSSENQEEQVETEESFIEKEQLLGNWLLVKTEIHYDGVVNFYPEDSTVLLIEEDSLWRGSYPYYVRFSIPYSYHRDTLFDDLNEPMYSLAFSADTLLVRNIDSRMIAIDYFVLNELNPEGVRDLKKDEVCWDAHQYKWKFEESELHKEDKCGFKEALDLDLTKTSNYFTDGNWLYYLKGKDTIGFSHISSSDSSLELLHHCEELMVIHPFSYSK